MKQSNPANLDAAVSATLELDSYAMPKESTLLVLGVESEAACEEKDTTVGAVNMLICISNALKKLRVC